MKDFLKKLGIDGEPIKSGNLYVIDITDSDEYGKIYSRLDKSDLVEEVADSSQMTYENASIQFESDDYLITLLADFEADNYKITIKEL
jgi:hypothetical protein